MSVRKGGEINLKLGATMLAREIRILEGPTDRPKHNFPVRESFLRRTKQVFARSEINEFQTSMIRATLVFRKSQLWRK